MDLRRLITFAQQAAAPISTQTTPLKHMSNVNLIGILNDVAQDLHITSADTLHFEDAFTLHVTHNYFNTLLSGKRDDSVAPQSLLPTFIQATHKLRDAYYAPIIHQAQKDITQYNAAWDHLNDRFDFLVQQSETNPHYADLLHDEFYMDGSWAPELEEEYKTLQPSPQNSNVLDITRVKTLRELRQIFRAEIAHPDGAIMLEMAIPNNLTTINRKQNAAFTQKYNAEIMVTAINTLTDDLQALLPTTPQNTVVPFPIRRAARPALRF